ncbi:MAG: glycosyltransferase [Maribacter sp.]|nr:glycosyltransferase [Maribacter sp.]
MPNSPDIVIVVPCYNEQIRLPVDNFTSFLVNHPRAKVCLVNDASTDDTIAVLHSLQITLPKQVFLLNNELNLGKAESVRKGVLYCSKNKLAPYIAYLDADLATSLEECYGIGHNLDSRKSFVFASRILKIGSVVERRFSRFLFGRIIATFISNILDIKVYDTQCGCKVFNSEITDLMFEKPFISKWLFDVELFSRILCHYGKTEGLNMMEEIPVKQWIDQGKSKVKITYFFRLWYDLFLIRKAHRKNMKHNLV